MPQRDEPKIQRVPSADLYQLEIMEEPDDILAPLHNPDTAFRTTRYFSNWRRHFSNIYNDLDLISMYDDVCYLLDSDILQYYIERDFNRHESLLQNIETIIEHSDVDLALPQGTYLELLDYLRRLLGGSEAFLFGDGYQAFIPGQKITEVISDVIRTSLRRGGEDALGKTHQALVRLHELLSLDRFRGVIRQYRQEDKIRIEEIVSLLPRTDLDSSRDIRDERDAINIAITLPGLRSALNRHRQSNQSQVTYISGYLLISNSALVVSLFRF